MPSVSDLERSYLLDVIGAPGVGKTLTDLRYMYYKGIEDGSITVGGEADPAEVALAVEVYLDANPPTVASTTSLPEIPADSPTTFVGRAAYIAAVYPGYVGRVVYNSERYLDHPAPTDYQIWDAWIRRRTV